MQCALCTVQCVHCALCPVHCVLYTVHSALCSVPCVLCTVCVQCALCSERRRSSSCHKHHSCSLSLFPSQCTSSACTFPLQCTSACTDNCSCLRSSEHCTEQQFTVSTEQSLVRSIKQENSQHGTFHCAASWCPSAAAGGG